MTQKKKIHTWRFALLFLCLTGFGGCETFDYSPSSSRASWSIQVYTYYFDELIDVAEVSSDAQILYPSPPGTVDSAFYHSSWRQAKENFISKVRSNPNQYVTGSYNYVDPYSEERFSFHWAGTYYPPTRYSDNYYYNSNDSYYNSGGSYYDSGSSYYGTPVAPANPYYYHGGSDSSVSAPGIR